jgi:hypothetical protein
MTHSPLRNMFCNPPLLQAQAPAWISLSSPRPALLQPRRPIHPRVCACSATP